MSAIEVVVMGGSAGSLDALSRILPDLPADFPVPVLVVVHIPPDKHSVMAEIFREKCPLDVREAQDKEPLEAGAVYFAPPDYHLQVEVDRHASLSYDEPRMYSRPSIDVLFESAAEVFGPGVAGVVLSGGNSDGAAGLRRILEAGGVGIVQAPADAQNPAMPRAALEICPGAEALDARGIPAILTTLCSHGK